VAAGGWAGDGRATEEPVLPCGVHLGEEVEERVRGGGRVGGGRQGDGGGRHLVDVGGQAGRQGGDSERVHGQQPLRGGGRAADAEVGGRRRSVARGQAGGRCGDAEGDRVVRPDGQRVPDGRRPRAPADPHQPPPLLTGRRPQRRRRRPRVGLRIEEEERSDELRRGRGRSDHIVVLRTTPRPGAVPRPVEPIRHLREEASGPRLVGGPARGGGQTGGNDTRGVQAPPQEGRQRGGVVHHPGGDRLFHAAGVRVPAGRQSRVREGEQRSRHQNRK
jgi:hypothetical protein